MKAKTYGKKYEELWSKIEDLIRSTNNKSDEYDEKYMKMKINSDDDLSLRETLKSHDVMKVIRSVFNDANKY